MSEHIEILTSWKKELSSEDSEEITKALVEIIVVIEEVNSEGICESAYEVLINRDLCHFLCELLSIDRLNKTVFINTIICYLSESSSFYKNEFFRVLKIFLRLLTSMNETKFDSTSHQYIDDIFRCLSLILMRAQQYEVDFSGDRILVQRLLSALGTLSENFFHRQSMLQLFNQVLEIMLSTIHMENEQERQCHLESLIIITRNWRLYKNNMYNIDTYHAATEATCNLIDYIIYPRTTNDTEMILLSLVTEKILILTEIALKNAKNSEMILSIFRNFWFHLMLSLDDFPGCKVQIVNLFVKLNGYDLFLRSIQNINADPIVDKEMRLILSETMTYFTLMLQNIDDKIVVSNLRKSFYHMFSKRDPGDNHPDDDKMKIVNLYVALKLNSFNSDQNPLVEISELILKLTADKVTLDAPFVVMMLTIYVEFFEMNGASQKGNSVSKAQTILLKNYKCVKPEINENFIYWWLHKNASKREEFEQLMLNLISRDFFECNTTSIYDLQWLGKTYLDEIEKTQRINILKILSQSRSRMIEIRKFVTRLQKCIEKKIEFEVSGILDILSHNSYHYNIPACNFVAPSVHRVFDTRFNNIEMRLKAIELGKGLLIRIIFHFKSNNKKLSFDD